MARYEVPPVGETQGGRVRADVAGVDGSIDTDAGERAAQNRDQGAAPTSARDKDRERRHALNRTIVRVLAKHLLDRVAAALLLTLLAPLLALIGWSIRREDGGPVWFRQQRAGRGGATFDVYKFRSMVMGADRSGLGLNVEQGDARITRVGQRLRDWSLDELPQLINVVRGEMSLVGPRPGLPDQAARYDALQRRRLEVRPGLTGWAQVNGRNRLTWEERIVLDVWYVDHRSLALDARILARTIGVVLRREDLFGEGGANADLGGDRGAKGPVT